MNNSKAAKRSRAPGRARGQSSRSHYVFPQADLLIAGRYRVTNVFKPEGTSVAFAAIDEELAERVMLITGTTEQRLELDPLIVSPFLQFETWLAANPHIVSFREVLTTPVRRYLVTDAPKGQRLSTVPGGFPLPVVETTARSFAGAVQRLNEFGHARHSLDLDLEHVWIEPNGAAQLGGIEHALGGAQLIGGWAGLDHAPPETIAATKEFDGDAFKDPDGLLRHLHTTTLRATDKRPRRDNWFGWGRVILWMLTGAHGQMTLSANPSARQILALRPDCPDRLATAVAGLLQLQPEARDPSIAAMTGWLGEPGQSTERSRTASTSPPTDAPPLGASSGSRTLSGTENLSRREVQVLNLIAQGLTNQEMADRLVLSHHTADSHVQNVYRKLGVTGRIDASMLAIQDNLLPKSSDTGRTSRS